MIIKNKRESTNKIKELGLNHFAEEVFELHEVEKIKDFIKNNPAKEYCLRDPSKTNGKFFFAETLEDCLLLLANYDSLVTICVSANEFDDDIVLLGDIKITNNFGENIIDITARCDNIADHRNIYENPTYNMHTDLQDNKLWDIPGFSKLLNYIIEYEIYDVVVEFVVYDCPVGVNKEKIAIFELRSDY